MEKDDLLEKRKMLFSRLVNMRDDYRIMKESITKLKMDIHELKKKLYVLDMEMITKK